MANYSSLLAAVNAAITANGTGAITGPVLNTVLQQMIVSLGQGGYIFKGRAIPTMDPGSPDQNVFYIATTPGTYTNFSSIVVAAGECAILKGSGTSWSKEATGIDLVSVSQNTSTGHTDITIGDTTTPVASVEEVNQLGQDVEILSKDKTRLLTSFFSGTIPYSSSAGTRGYWPQNDIQKRLRGHLITGVSLNFSTTGKFSIFRGTSILDSFNRTLVQQFEITKTGVNILNFDNPFVLSDDEWLGVYDNVNDTAIPYYSSDAQQLPYNIPFYYWSTSINNWSTSNGLQLEVYCDFRTIQTESLEEFNNNVSEFEQNKNIQSGCLKSTFSGVETYSSRAGENGFWLVDSLQKLFRGRYVFGIKLNIEIPGTLSILKGSGIGTANYTINTIETCVINNTGIVYIPFSQPIILENDEWLGWFLGGIDTAYPRYSPQEVDDILHKEFTYYARGAWQPGGTANLDCEIIINPVETSPLLNKFIKKRISLLGDSITTFSGQMPSGYAAYYPSGNVDDVKKCYWYIVAKELQMAYNNCAWSGSQVTGDSESTTNAYAGCSNKRISDLGRDGFTPDIVWVYIGINDWGRNVPIGNWTPAMAIPQEGTITDFSSAYALMLWKIQSTYPNAKIFCSPLMIDAVRDADAQWPPVNGAGVSLKEYNDKIIEIASALGANIIEMPACGINWANKSQFFTDGGLHPNEAGHKKMANQMVAQLIAKY